MQGDVEAREKKMVPLERRVGDGVLRVLSMGFLADEDTAIMWRGLILNRAVQQFLEDVHWGDLDFLLIDMPPGHRRHPDGPGPDDAPHRGPRGHHAAAGRPEGGRPHRRHGPQGLPAGDRGHREHERLHLRARRRPTRCSAPAAATAWPPRSGCRSSVGCRCTRRSPPGATPDAGGPGRRPAAGRRVRPDRRGPGGQPPEVVSMDGCSARMLERVEAAVAGAAE